MFKRPRIIPVLTISDGGLVKTTRFRNPSYLGDPINAVKIFNEKTVDELVLLDISNNRHLKGPNFKLLKEVADEAFMPLAYGGGIRTVDDGLQVLSIGFEKLVFNTAIEENPSIIEELIQLVGGQSIVLSLDYRNRFGGLVVYTNNGKKKFSKSVNNILNFYERMGVGEIIMQSIDRDGTRDGYDISILKTLASLTNLPMIALGGCSGLSDIRKLIKNTKINAFAAGHLFVYYGRRNGILINFPSDLDFYREGIYHE